MSNNFWKKKQLFAIDGLFQCSLNFTKKVCLEQTLDYTT